MTTFEEMRDNVRELENLLRQADLMRHDQRDQPVTMSHCDCDNCEPVTDADSDDGKVEGFLNAGYENHQGDGASGYDFFSDTRRWC